MGLKNIGSKIPSKKIKNFIIILVALIYLICEIFVANTCGHEGSVAFIMNFIIIFMLLFGFPFALLEILSKNVREQVDIMSTRNCIRMLKFSNMAVIVYDIAVVLIIILFGNKIESLFKILQGGNFILLMLLAYFLLTSLCFVFYGFLLGCKLKRSLYFLLQFKAVVSLFCIIFFKGFFAKNAEISAKLLYNPVISDLFEGAGIAIGLGVASFITLLACLYIYRREKHGIISSDRSKRRLDVYDIVARVVKPSFSLALNQISFPLMFIISGILFFNLSAGEEPISKLILYKGSGYFVYLLIILFSPLIIAYMYSFFDRKTIAISAYAGDKHEIRFKVSDMHKKFAIYYFPFIVFLTVNAPVILDAFFGVKSEYITAVLYICLPSGIFLGLTMISKNILIGLGEFLCASLSGGISLVVFGCITVFGHAVMGDLFMVVGLYAFAVVYMLLAMIFVRKNIKFSPGFNKRFLRPLLCMVPIFVISLVLRLILGLILPSIAVLIISGTVNFFIAYLFYILSGAVNYMSVSKSPAAFILLPIGKMIGLRKTE